MSVPLNNVLGQLQPNSGLLAALGPKPLASFDNPGQMPVSPTAQAQMNTQKEIALGTNRASLLSTILPLEAQQKQNDIQNQLNFAKLGNETELNQADIEAKRASTADTATSAQQKALNLQKDQLLMHAAQVGGTDAYMGVLAAIDPEKHAQVRKAQEEVNTSVLGQKKTIQDMNEVDRKTALDSYDKINGVAQAVLLAPEADRAKIYERSADYLQRIAPDLDMPAEYNGHADAILHGALLAHTNIIEELNKGSVGLGTQLTNPDAIAGAKSSLNANMGQPSGAPIQGIPSGPGQKTVQADIFNPAAGDVPNPGQSNLSPKIAPKVTRAQEGIKYINAALDNLKGGRLNLDDALANILKGADAQKQDLILSKINNAVADYRGVNSPNDIRSELPSMQDVGTNVQQKLESLKSELENFTKNAGVNPITAKSQETGLHNPVTNLPITMDQIQQAAKEEGRSVESVMAEIKQLTGKK